MKKIFSSPDLLEVAHLQGMLESAGIAAVIRNEVSAGLTGGIPLSECTPELWIQDDHKLAEAEQIKGDWQTAAVVVGSPWGCPACGETLEAQFTSCWKCGATKT